MDNSYSVKAVLSASDKGFSAAMKNATRATNALGSKIKSGLSFGVFAGIGQQAFASITNSARELIGEISESNAAWKTFSSNMSMLGKGKEEIEDVKEEMQKFAEQTIYSSSDMATTYAQLAAVGTKNCTQLVKGFGGLAAAAENPQQAMKTLSMQATQMAAKPTVAWQDFKLMLEQTPAGIAAVAKEMGMTTSELVTAVQDGTVKTDEFFDAITKVGTNDAFTKLATEYKTVGQAMDGLKETVGNKLTPAFDVLSQKAIDSISKIVDKLGKIDGEKIAKKLEAGLKKAQPYVNILTSSLSALGKVLKTIGKILLEHANIFSKIVPIVLTAVGAFKAFNFLKNFNPFSFFTKNAEQPLQAITQKARSSASTVRQVFNGLANVIKSVGQAASVAAKGIGGGLATAFRGLGMALKLANPVVILAIGAAISMVAATFSIFKDAGKPIATIITSIGSAFGRLSPLVKAAGNAFSKAANAIGSAASKIISALSNLVKSISSVVNSLANGLKSVGQAIKTSFEGIASVMEGVGSAIAKVLNSISSIIESVGNSALNAGKGFKFLAEGVKTIVGTELSDLAASLSAVAIGIGKITAKGKGITEIGNSMRTLSLGMTMLSVNAINAAAGMNAIATSAFMMLVPMQMLNILLTTASNAVLQFTNTAMIGFASLGTASNYILTLISSITVLTTTIIGSIASIRMFAVASISLNASSVVGATGLALLSNSAKGARKSMDSLASASKRTGGSFVSLGNTVKRAMGSVVSGSNKAKSALRNIQAITKSVGTEFISLSNKAKNAINKIITAMNTAANKAKSIGIRFGKSFTSGMKLGLSNGVSVARSSVNKVVSALKSGKGRAFTAGAYISIGFANGMRSQLGSIRSAAAQMAAAADKAVRAKAKIHSPSRVSTKLGSYWGKGFGNGMLDMVGFVKKASDKLINIPTINTTGFSLAYAGEISSDYEYYRNSSYTIVVPVEIDGREIARMTAPYTEEELNKRNARSNRKRGKI